MKELRKVLPAKLDLGYSVRDSIPLIDRYSVSDAVTNIQDCASGPTSSEQTQDRLIAKVKFRDFEYLEPKYLNSSLEVTLIGPAPLGSLCCCWEAPST
jgi:hypothetical protein